MLILSSLFFVIVGVVFGAIGSTVGGSSLVSVPFLISIGLSTVSAIATSKFAILASFITGGFKYSKDGFLKEKKLAILLSIPALLGSIAGSFLVLRIEQATLSKIVTVLLILVFGLTLIKNDTNTATKKIQVTKTKKALGILAMFALGVYSGFFGAGFGAFAILSLVYLLGYSFLESAALMTVINFFALLTATVIFIGHGAINYADGIPLLFGGAIGGWLGAKYAVIKGNVWIRRIFLLITAGLIINLILKN